MDSRRGNPKLPLAVDLPSAGPLSEYKRVARTVRNGPQIGRPIGARSQSHDRNVVLEHSVPRAAAVSGIGDIGIGAQYAGGDAIVGGRRPPR